MTATAYVATVGLKWIVAKVIAGVMPEIKENESKEEKVNFTRCARPIVRLLFSAACFMALPSWGQVPTAPTKLSQVSPHSDKNYISTLSVERDSQERWIASCTFGVVGQDPTLNRWLEITWSDADEPGRPNVGNIGTVFRTFAKEGSYQVSGELVRPAARGNLTTKWVVAKLVHRIDNQDRVLATQYLALRIEWPDYETYQREVEVKTKTRDEVLTHAAELINANFPEALDSAKRLLQQLLLKDPNADAAYLELARIAMKTKWGEEGLREAEALISSAMQIRPNNPDALILQGYVYSHQQRAKEAEAAFLRASRTNPENPWLWTNWGELLAAQGKADAAMQMYRKAIQQPVTRNTYDATRGDAARQYAYRDLLALLEERNDVEGLDRLYESRTQEYKDKPCYKAEYARFRLRHRGDADNAISLAQQSIGAGCREADARQTLGLAYYTAWAHKKGAERNELLNRARIFYPPNASLLYELSTSTKTFAAALELIAGGQSVDQPDNRRLNALAYAIINKHFEAVGRLLKLGARPEQPVGEAGIPAALIPLMSSDYEAIRQLRKLGINYAKISFQGITALDYAKRTGDKKLQDALGGEPGKV